MSTFFRKLRWLLQSRRREEELREELEFHLAEEAEQRQAEGLSAGQASCAARRDLGNPTLTQENTRAIWTWTILEQLLQDLRYAGRQLSKDRSFTIVAVMLLAFGIGANTAIYSVLDAILLRELPVRQPGQLMFFGKAEPEGSTHFLPSGSTQVFSYPFFRDFKRRQQVFSELAAISSFLETTHGRLVGRADPERIRVELVSGSFFATMGVAAYSGRLLSEMDDETAAAHPVAVARYSWWRDRFAEEPSTSGKTITIGQTQYTIIGVAPPEFTGVTVGRVPDLWIPLTMEKQISPDLKGLNENLYQSLHMIGRLKPNVSRRQAQANTNLLFQQIQQGYLGPRPSQERLDALRRATVDLSPGATGRSNLRNEFSESLWILMATVVVVLLIACANVASLLLVRGAARQQEIAVRMSLGAERGRLIRQFLTESALLGAFGAALGVAISFGASRLLLSMVSPEHELIPIRVTPDSSALAFTALVTLLTVFIFGGAPALRATALRLGPAMRTNRGVLSPAAPPVLLRWLTAGQVALSLMLLVGSGLFRQSLANVANVEVGFDRQNVIRLQIDTGAANYRPGAQLDALMARVEERVSALPGIHAASFALTVFDGGGWSQDDLATRGGSGTEKNTRVFLNIVGPQFFDVLKTPVVFGRAFRAQDIQGHRKVAIINETMARTHFPGGSAIGRAFSVGDETEWQGIEVVGIVKDAKYMDIEEPQFPAAFFPYQRNGGYLRNLVVRYTGDASLIVSSVRQTIREIDANLPVSEIRTLGELVDGFKRNRRAVAHLSAAFGILSALMACIGIFGVVSYGVARRTGEFGIRMALGADRSNVLWLVLREALWLAVPGAGIGVVFALATGRLVESLLFGVKSDNPLVIGWALVAIISAALLAGYLPAHRATRIDPSTALRNE